MKLRQSISATLLAILFASISMFTFARGNGPIGDRNAAAKTTTAEVKYLDGQDGDLLYNVLYKNVSGSHFSVAILDEYGNQLYKRVFTDKKFDKKFKLADPENTSRLTFVIRNYADNTVQRFQVDATNRTVEEVEVKELR